MHKEARTVLDVDAPATEPFRVYQEVADVYDRAADVWGPSFGTGPQGARAKGVAMRRIRRLVPPQARLLDLGCDIGFEAIHFARLGHKVVGIDLSPSMLKLAGLRRRQAGVSAEDCRFLTMPAGQVGTLHPETFDGAYSVYGALNLEPDLEAMGRGLAGLLPEDAPFVVGLLNRSPLYELAVYPLALRVKGWKKLLRPQIRLRVARGAQDAVPCRMYTPGQFARRMRPWFRLERCTGIHLFLPPPGPRLLAHRRLLSRVNRLEDRIGATAPWNRLGYFSLLEMRRTAVGVEDA